MSDSEDAARYRFLRHRAIRLRDLETFVAFGAADHIQSEEKFDEWIDRERAPSEKRSQVHAQLQHEHGWVWHQSCGCALCQAETERRR